MKLLLPVLVLAVLATSCTMPPPPSPSARIGKHFDKFSKLSVKDKGLVRRGEIAIGMSKDAVMIAWGEPSRVFEGGKEGKNRERWEYVKTRAVQDPYGPSPFYPSYRHGRCYGYRDPYMGHHTTYVSYTTASVTFVDGKVESWERAR